MKLNRKNYITLCWVILATAFALAGCKSGVPHQPTADGQREINDDLGRRVKIPAQVERAVSLAPNLTEIVFAVDAGEKLVGDTTYCDYPAAAQKVQKVGDTLNPNLETIIALKPQVVFVSTASQMENFTKTLEAQNISVFVTDPKDLDGVYRSIRQIGEILGKDNRASEVVDEMKRRAAIVKAKTNTANRVKTFVQIAGEPLFTIGKNSFVTDLISRAGGISVTANVAEDYPKFSKETALALQPEAIILSDSPDNFAPNDVFKTSPAVKNGRVYKIKAELLSRPGPRLIDGLEQIARALHPESFQ